MPKQDFKIGADPEFGFLSNDRVVEAIDIIECENEDRDQFGIDGCAVVAELRPSPSTNPLEVVSNIASVMYEGAKRNPETAGCVWKAGSDVKGNPIGGHIHFGTNEITRRNKPRKQVFLRALDTYLAQTVILLEDPEEAVSRRQDSDYGGLSDCRDQRWGFEYRTPSSWLTSPYVAAGVLCLAKAIVWETLYNGLDSGSDYEDIDEDAFIEADLKPIRATFKKDLWPDIRKFELYKKYKQPINFLHTLIENKKNWFPTCGMKTAWGVESTPDVGPLEQTTIKDIWSGVTA